MLHQELVQRHPREAGAAALLSLAGSPVINQMLRVARQMVVKLDRLLRVELRQRQVDRNPHPQTHRVLHRATRCLRLKL